MAGVPGFEPGITIPKTVALPLGHTPTFFLPATCYDKNITRGLVFYDILTQVSSHFVNSSLFFVTSITEIAGIS